MRTHGLCGALVLAICMVPASSKPEPAAFGDGEFWISNYGAVERAQRTLEQLLDLALWLRDPAVEHGWVRAMENAIRRFESHVADFDALVDMHWEALDLETRMLIMELYGETFDAIQPLAAAAGDVMGNIGMVSDFLGSFESRRWIEERRIWEPTPTP